MTRDELMAVGTAAITQVGGYGPATARVDAAAVIDAVEPHIAHDARHVALREVIDDVQSMSVRLQSGSATWVRVDHVMDILRRRSE